jgi:hypothetical protein
VEKRTLTLIPKGLFSFPNFSVSRKPASIVGQASGKKPLGGLRIPEPERQSASALDTVWFQRNPIMGLPALQLVLDTQFNRKYVPIYESKKNRYSAADFL